MSNEHVCNFATIVSCMCNTAHCSAQSFKEIVIDRMFGYFKSSMPTLTELQKLLTLSRRRGVELKVIRFKHHSAGASCFCMQENGLKLNAPLTLNRLRQTDIYESHSKRICVNLAIVLPMKEADTLLAYLLLVCVHLCIQFFSTFATT